MPNADSVHDNRPRRGLSRRGATTDNYEKSKRGGRRASENNPESAPFASISPNAAAVSRSADRRRANNINIPRVIPVRHRVGPIQEGDWYWSNKIYFNLSIEQQLRLGACNPGTVNKCRKLRPWVVKEVLANGLFVVMCSTTREGKVWEGLTPQDTYSFLPIAPTPEVEGRAAVEMEDDAQGVMVGASMIFLEEQITVNETQLFDYFGKLSKKGLRTLRAERRRCKLALSPDASSYTSISQQVTTSVAVTTATYSSLPTIACTSTLVLTSSITPIIPPTTTSASAPTPIPMPSGPKPNLTYARILAGN